MIAATVALIFFIIIHPQITFNKPKINIQLIIATRQRRCLLSFGFVRLDVFQSIPTPGGAGFAVIR
ncbi:hypothetical protein, partial [Serratia marcescens]|uniref:hypothetical protein n=1 Tax=Serratia marcescens TaxID=615 RepID=UPI002361CADB